MRKLRMLPVLCALLAPSLTQAREYIKITDPNFRPYPLAVPEFKAMEGLSDELAKSGTEILRFDLGAIGVFKLVDSRSFIADPKQEGLGSGSIKFTDWINVGAEGLVKVGVHKEGAQVVLDCHLFDVGSGSELLHKKYEADEEGFRTMVHKWGDDVVRHFTGNPSVFFTKVVFAKKAGATQKSKDICIVDFDGYNERCVVKDGELNLLPAWTGDAKGIYYSSYKDGGPHLWLTDLKSKKVSIISKYPGLNVGAAGSPDGKSVALTLSKDENSEIYRLDRDGGNPKRLTRDWAIDSSPAWSPDAKRLAFVSERSGNPQIYVMNGDGSGVRRLTFQGNYNQTPHWSPRGDWILFNARDERLVYDIFKINPDTGEIQRLTQDSGNNEHPTWSPDGNQVVFSSTRSGESKLYLMNLDGTNQRPISRNKGEYTTPEWSPWLEEK